MYHVFSFDIRTYAYNWRSIVTANFIHDSKKLITESRNTRIARRNFTFADLRYSAGGLQKQNCRSPNQAKATTRARRVDARKPKNQTVGRNAQRIGVAAKACS